jgi:hypothetical protein
MGILSELIADAEHLALLRWWLDARCGREMPARPDFDPLDHPDLLPRLFLVSVSPQPPHFRYRLCGTEIDLQQGYSMTGRTFEEVFSGELLRFTHERFVDTAFNRRISYHTTHFSNDNSAKAVRFTRLLLPLLGADGRVEVILGSRVMASRSARSYADLDQDAELRQRYTVAVVDAAKADRPCAKVLATADDGTVARPVP